MQIYQNLTVQYVQILPNLLIWARHNQRPQCPELISICVIVNMMGCT